MAGPSEMDTGQFLTYLFLHALPLIIATLAHQAAHQDKTIRMAFLRQQTWRPQHGHRTVPRKKAKRYTKPVSFVSEGVNRTHEMRAYLFPLAMAAFKAGCRMESLARHLCRRTRAHPLHLRAFLGREGPSEPPPLLFDSDPMHGQCATPL